MLEALIGVPIISAAIAFLCPSDRFRPWLLPAAGLVHLGALGACLYVRQPASPRVWLELDALGTILIGLVSVLFLICGLYAPRYLALRAERPNRVFCACLLLFLATASMVLLSRHLGLLWVATEALTLVTAPLVYFNRNSRSIAATWNYLMICSVGIALALLGSLFLAYSAHIGGSGTSLLFDDLASNAGGFAKPWLRAAFVLLLLGYGTKMGLAPLHTWKPEAYGEAPGIVGAILAGGVTSCAFAALLRVYRIINIAGEGPFARKLLVFMGLLSMAWAAAFMVRQRDFKKLLAYSSIEHMGILVLGIGIGGAGVWGAILHAINNGLTKGAMFLTAGNIHRAYGAKTTGEVRGALRRVPVSAGVFLAAFFAITGSPPFGPFVSQFTVLNAAIGGGHGRAAAVFLILLGVVFLGMGATVMSVLQGTPSAEAEATNFRDELANVAPAIAAILIVLVLGLWIPDPLGALIDQAAAGLEARP